MGITFVGRSHQLLQGQGSNDDPLRRQNFYLIILSLSI